MSDLKIHSKGKIKNGDIITVMNRNYTVYCIIQKWDDIIIYAEAVVLNKTTKKKEKVTCWYPLSYLKQHIKYKYFIKKNAKLI